MISRLIKQYVRAFNGQLAIEVKCGRHVDRSSISHFMGGSVAVSYRGFFLLLYRRLAFVVDASRISKALRWVGVLD